MSRVIWKGAISFGLVHVPVALYPGSQESGIDFDWLDKRTMDPVGYKRVNKRTGREIANEQIVKGIKQDSGDYVVLGEDEIKAAYPKSTQTIAIESFASAAEISYAMLERPYVTAPIGKSDKVYALLREAMREAGVVGIARVVLHTKERLAALVADRDALVLNTIRWADELRPRDDIELPPAGKAAGLKDAELKMARQLIADMTAPFDPKEHEDRFTAAIHALAKKRVAAGKTEQVTALEDEAPEAASNVVDLTELLRQSLSSRKLGAGGAKKAAPGRAAAAPRKKAAAKKRAA